MITLQPIDSTDFIATISTGQAFVVHEYEGSDALYFHVRHVASVQSLFPEFTYNMALKFVQRVTQD